MYDLIVIGDDLSSHVSAAYASGNGLNTLLIAESGLGGLNLIGDFIFNIDPTPITGLGREQPGLSVLIELGIVLPEDHALPINTAFQVILPDQRIDFHSDPVLLQAELAREFPELADDIKDFYNIASDASDVFQNWLTEHPQLQPNHPQEYLAYLKILPYIIRYKYGAVHFDKILSKNASLEKAWEAQQALLSFNNEDLFSFASAFQYCSPMRGVSFFPQGKQFLFNALIEKIESNKGLYLNHYQVSSITRNKTIDLEIKGSDGATTNVSGLNLVVSTKSDALSLLQQSRQHLNLSDWLRPVRVIYRPFTIFLGIAATCLPEQMARHVAVVSDVTRDLYDNNLIILETSLLEKDKAPAHAKTSLTATVYLPDQQEKWTPDALKREADSILARLDVFFPFLRDHVEMSDIDKAIDISSESRKVVSPKYKVRNSFFTSFAAKNNKTLYDNVFLTGTSLLSDAGFDGEILSGKNAALRVIQKRS
ncbi:MAG: hypothetical protein CVU52_09495 [Deltaproteobacteria bacterium HGW-Deltaproteobacteria-10]|jgi:phytoene dehydrogenase-like protein|nr:MAG: hypothetical protein CVU52_09495 [Deltaproteobacteria bacterium HGW-Deltaproteobacteria-10]